MNLGVNGCSGVGGCDCLLLGVANNMCGITLC